MPARKSQFQFWYEQVKRELLITEPQNILARAECCQNIINECVSHMNKKLQLPILQLPQQYKCNLSPKVHLKFLLNWPGLRIDNSPKAPKSKKEYEKKSKNWLNGRRAPNYGKTLFPFFVSDAEKYLSSISKLLITNSNEKQRLYYEIIIYHVLSQLCSCTVSLHEQAKKAPFFCKNSVERKGRLKEIFQSYAPDHEYIQGFPSCYEEAIGYFDRKSNMYFNQYCKKYLQSDKNNNYDVQTQKQLKPIKPPYPMKNEQHGNNNNDAEYWKKQFLYIKRELIAERRMRKNAEIERDNLKNLINTSTDNMTPTEPIKPPAPSNNNINNNNNNNNMNICNNMKNMNMSNVQRHNSHNSHNGMCINNNHLSLRNEISHRSMQSMHSMDTVSTACGSVCNIANNMPSNINNINAFSASNNINGCNNHSQSCVHLNNINNTYVPTISNHHQTSFNNFYSNDMNLPQTPFIIPNQQHINTISNPFQPPSLNQMNSIIDTMPIINRPTLSNDNYNINENALVSMQSF